MQLDKKRWRVIHTSLITAGFEDPESEYVKMSHALEEALMILSAGRRQR